jgi:hypothetical protein
MLLSLLELRLGLDLHLPSRVEKASNHNHRRGRQYVAEDVGMGTAHRFAVVRVCEIHPRSDDISRLSACVSQSGKDDLEAPGGLDVDIFIARTVGPDWSRP